MGAGVRLGLAAPRHGPSVGSWAVSGTSALARRCSSPAETQALAGALACLVRSGDIVVLSGEMGAGKTAFAQGFAAALGVTEPVTSPTFTLVHSYPLPAVRAARTEPGAPGPVVLHHADLYRLGSMHEIADLALGELAEAGGVLLVEWGDVAGSALGDHLEVHLAFAGDDDDRGDASGGSDGADRGDGGGGDRGGGGGGGDGGGGGGDRGDGSDGGGGGGDGGGDGADRGDGSGVAAVAASGVGVAGGGGELTDTVRDVTIAPHGARWVARWPSLVATLERSDLGEPS